MNKRTFLKLSSTLMAAPLVSPLTGWAQEEPLKNWSGNLEYSTHQVSYPQSVGELQELVKKTARFKVLGTRHCFNKIADSKDHLISTKNLNKIISLDTKAHTITVEGGIKYGELCPYLDGHGYALHNLASLPHISVAGACATATHGSGVANKNLSSVVSGLEMVTADGGLHTLTRADGDSFNAAVVGLGALGVVTKVTLDLKPAYKMRQYVFEKMPMSQVKEHFEKILSAGYSVSLFTDWQTDYINEVWIKSLENERTDFTSQQNFYGAKAATKNMHPIAALSAENCTEQMGVAGTWYERLPHFKMGFTPSSGVELQSEYFIPHHNAMDAILAVSRLSKDIGPHLFISEIRTINADDLWMSPCYKQSCVTIHFTWKQDWPAVSKLLPRIEKELSPFNARPHWGKLFTMSPEVLHKRYEKLPEFKKMIAQYDPKGKFRNEFLNAYL
jgi:xylitol oxidase